MEHICPQCRSINVRPRDYAKKAGGAIGAVAGGAAGVAGVMSGAEIGATVGMAAGPVGAAVGGLFGALLGGLFGAAAGGVTGSKIGKVVDDTLLDNYQCLSCGHVFSETTVEPDSQALDAQSHQENPVG